MSRNPHSSLTRKPAAVEELEHGVVSEPAGFGIVGDCRPGMVEQDIELVSSQNSWQPPLAVGRLEAQAGVGSDQLLPGRPAKVPADGGCFPRHSAPRVAF